MNSNDLSAIKKIRKAHKKTHKRRANANEVLYIFEETLKGRKSIQIYNEIKRKNPKSIIEKKNVSKIMTGNCKLFPNELSNENYNYYTILREKVYDFHKK